jgi:hypothetical protein
VDSRVKYGILIVVGGVGVYLLWKGNYLAQWMPSVFGPGAPLGSAVIPSAPVGATPAQIAAQIAAQPTTQPTTLPTVTPSVPAVPAPTPVTTPSPAPASITPAAATQIVSQKMVSAAGMSSGLSTDEWCLYFTQVTGSDCPVDPGSIDPTVYHDAGVLAADGSGNPGDRSTPTDIGTWLAIMQNQAPSAGLSGLAGLAALRVANAWLV